MDDLKKLLELAKGTKLSDTDREAQRRSFAYGNTHIENDRITRKMVDDAAESLRKAPPSGNEGGRR